MKRSIVSFVVGAMVAIALFGGNKSPVPQPVIEAQAQNAKESLINKTRQWCKDQKKVDDDGQSITNSWNQISSTISSPGDFVGSNSGLTKTQMTSVITTIGN